MCESALLPPILQAVLSCDQVPLQLLPHFWRDSQESTASITSLLIYVSTYFVPAYVPTTQLKLLLTGFPKTSRGWLQCDPPVLILLSCSAIFQLLNPLPYRHTVLVFLLPPWLLRLSPSAGSSPSMPLWNAGKSQGLVCGPFLFPLYFHSSWMISSNIVDLNTTDLW